MFDPDAAAPTGLGIYGLPFPPAEARVVVVPVPFEATTSYGGGTSRGPQAVFEASKQVDLFDRETGKPYEAGIAMLGIPKKVARWNREGKALAKPVIEAGGVSSRSTRAAAAKVNALSEKLNEWVYATTKALLDDGKMPVTLGGDHAAPYGAIRAYADRYPGLGILHLDAHSALPIPYEGFTCSHASIFHNVMTRLDRVGRLVP